MIKISKLSDYASVVLSTLVSDPQTCLSAADIAAQTALAQPTVSKVLKLLHDASIVNSHRGAKGGYLLARPPEQISLAQVIQAIEGEWGLTQCAHHTLDCVHQGHCQVRGNWQLVNWAVVQLFESISFADMAGTMSAAGMIQKWLPLLSEKPVEMI